MPRTDQERISVLETLVSGLTDSVKALKSSMDGLSASMTAYNRAINEDVARMSSKIDRDVSNTKDHMHELMRQHEQNNQHQFDEVGNKIDRNTWYVAIGAGIIATLSALPWLLELLG